ncbi:bone morphogenetic protein 15 [Protopterus annectens]|uniref:bone morphogenetic protein 15 n=1 Tax=Protopterus annectens TaxID=7888 RepID=UPI001CFAE8D1|nr:bone morphogenetic protein 15 [Protopterus annectens]
MALHNLYNTCNVFMFFLLLSVFFDKSQGATGLSRRTSTEDPAVPLFQALSEKVPHGVRWKRHLDGPEMHFMMDLYNRAADMNGRPKDNRTTGSDTIRMVKPRRGLLHHKKGPQSTQYDLKFIPDLQNMIKVAFVFFQEKSYDRIPISCQIKVLSKFKSRRDTNFDIASRLKSTFTISFNFQDKMAEVDITSHLFPLLKSLWNKCMLYLSYTCVKTGAEDRDNAGEHVHLQVPSLLFYLRDKLRKRQKMKSGMELTNEHKGTGPILSRKVRELKIINMDSSDYHKQETVLPNQCQLYSIRVSFQQLGWDHWIIAPHRYNPRYCKGDCPRVLHYGYHSPNHAIVQNFINERVDKNVPRPSCVPYKYKPISVLMIERNGDIVYKEYEDMIAESCTCK